MDEEPHPSATMVNDFWQQKYREDAAKNWNLFYRRNETRFFRDRHWIGREFPELMQAVPLRVLEAGCGVGNFALPLVEANSHLHIYACDFSPKAIQLLQDDERYRTSGRCTAFVADLSSATGFAQAPVEAHSLDIVTCIFVFSAIPPERFGTAVRNIKSLLRPGGLVLFRDYSKDDAALKRFKADRRLADTLFVRQDGTLAYYFAEDEVQRMFEAEGFTLEESSTVHSKTTNVKRDLDVDRFFIQAKFRFSPCMYPYDARVIQ